MEKRISGHTGLLAIDQDHRSDIQVHLQCITTVLKKLGLDYAICGI